MIAINKCAAPAGLVLAGEKHRKELSDAYEADPNAYADGSRKIQIRESIYTSKAVKAALASCHHGKCCYCEVEIRTPAYPHVEHWRPQNSSCQGRGDRRMWPGYYWLAYDWENLFWSCAFCNSSKSDLFPLEDPASRARQHGMRLEDETPTILKPNGDQNPRDHLAFHMEIPVGLTELGRKTIEVLRLDSPAHQERLAYLNRIRDACEIYIKLIGSADPIAREYAERAFQKLLEAVRPEKPYSAMVADYLAANPLPDHPA